MRLLRTGARSLMSLGKWGFSSSEVASETPPTQYALSFDGVDDIVTIPASSDVDITGQTKFSVEVNINLTTVGESTLARIVDKRSGGGGYLLATLNDSGGTACDLRVVVDHSTTDANAITSTTVAYGSYAHLVFTYNEDNDKKIKIYIDGSLATLATDDAGSGTVFDDSSDPLTLGNTVATTNSTYGIIKDFRVYAGKALSAAEVSTRNSDGAVAGATAHWSFLEGAGSTLGDVIGSNDGTITGATWVTA